MSASLFFCFLFPSLSWDVHGIRSCVTRVFFLEEEVGFFGGTEGRERTDV